MKALQYLGLDCREGTMCSIFLGPNEFRKYCALVGKRDVDRKSKAMEPQRPIMET